jgi:hypothetical protein
MGHLIFSRYGVFPGNTLPQNPFTFMNNSHASVTGSLLEATTP